MPRFYFDTSQGSDAQVRDDVGAVFETLIDARAHAMRKLPIATTAPPLGDGEFRTWTATVRDESGGTVGHFILAFIADATVDTIGPGGDRVLRSG